MPHLRFEADQDRADMAANYEAMRREYGSTPGQ
jgi:hypothetical protein